MVHNPRQIPGDHPPDCPCAECAGARSPNRPAAPRAKTPPQRPGFRKRLLGIPRSVWVCLILATALFGAVWLWNASPAVQETGRSAVGQVESLLDVECDQPRTRRRGGWVRAILC